MAINNVTQVIIPQQFFFDWLAGYYGLILEGYGMTMYLYATGLVFGFFFGLLLAVARQYGGTIVSALATGYIEFMRGTPMLVQIYVIYLFAPFINATFASPESPLIDLRWSVSVGGVIILNHQILSAMATMGLNSAAYQAEYFRGAMASVSSGQLLAARSIGMTRTESILSIVIPQSLRRVIPAWSNEAAYLPKYTVVASFIAVNDLFQNAAWIMSRIFVSLPVWLVVAAIFVVTISLISKALDYVYMKTKIPM
ncbi:MAG: amino acid ABC transporter permease [Candidatus Thorarchaeota archaeon]